MASIVVDTVEKEREKKDKQKDGITFQLPSVDAQKSKREL